MLSNDERRWKKVVFFRFRRGGDVLLEFRNSVGMGPEKIWKWYNYLQKIWKCDIYSDKSGSGKMNTPNTPPSRCCILLTSVCDHVFLKMFARGGESKICRCVGLGAEEEGVKCPLSTTPQAWSSWILCQKAPLSGRSFQILGATYC